ncbi:MAG: hypothetical protein WAM82_15495 [Thermoanaerobaculia bacterium]
MPEWLKSIREEIVKGVRAASVGKVVVPVMALIGVGLLAISKVWQSALAGHSEGLRLSVFFGLVALNLWSLWLALRTVRVEIRPVSGAQPQALVEITNRGRTGEFYASAKVLWAVGEGVMDFQDRTLRPSWKRSETSDPILLERDQAESLVLVTCSYTPWIGPEIPKGVEWFRIKLEDAGGHGEVFSSLTQEKTEICIRVTVARKKSPTEFRQPRSLVGDFIITGHPDWYLTIKPASSVLPPAAPPETRASG